MPPKNTPKKPNATKIIEDKTFGLKNKKGGKQQKYIAQITSSIQNSKKEAEAKAKKAAEKEKAKNLYNPIVVSDKKNSNVVCSLYKRGLCRQNDCKFLHDLSQLSLEPNQEKIINAPTHSENTTEIICKYFLVACEKSLYGPLWKCPNGLSCIYQHSLPANYVFKKNTTTKETSGLSIEELVEQERGKLGNDLTNINEKTFLIWKEKRLSSKEKKSHSEKKTGRDLFTISPHSFKDDDEACDVQYETNSDKTGWHYSEELFNINECIINQ